MKFLYFDCLCFYLFASFPPNRAYPDRGTMSEMRYANTKILIVTCYLLLVVISLALPSL